ncbi:MAG: hypothetical protein ACYDA9_17180 [Terriglobia bacterium]
MSIYKTAAGFCVDYRDEFGKRRRRFIGTEEAAREFNRQITNSILQTNGAFRHFSITV